MPFKYVIEFIRHGQSRNTKIIKVTSDDPFLSNKNLSQLWIAWRDGKSLSFFLDKYSKETHDMEIYSLPDWGNTLPFLIHKKEETKKDVPNSKNPHDAASCAGN